MFVSYKNKSVPFVNGNFFFNSDVFVEQGKQSIVTSKNDKRINGHAYNSNGKSALKPAIGEWIERYTLLTNKYSYGDRVIGFNMTTGKEQEIIADNLYLLDGEVFNDSCGVASHLSSTDVISSAFFEFFERQSLVFRWLTKTGGKMIKMDDIKDRAIKKLYEKAFNFVDNIYLIDISIHPSIHAILSIGYGEYYKAIGLSADSDLNKAITGSLEEFFQTFSGVWTKYHFSDKDSFEDLTYGNSSFNDTYKDYYFNMKPEDFYREYEFLIYNSEKLNIEVEKKEYRTNEIIDLISKELNINIICCFIPCTISSVKTKIVKVFSPNGYPHMYPVLFNQEETELVFNTDSKSFPNQYRQIPFP